ncbi:MAG: sodium:calcium symporter [Pseudomonadota bacterium]
MLEQIAVMLKKITTPEFYQNAGTLLFTPNWWQLLLCFLACSALMIICLNAIERNGFEGTLIGTLIMPYFSGFSNLCFAWLMAKKGSNGAVVLENCLVNNVTTLTLVLAIPAMLWGLNLFKGKHLAVNDMKINRLSLVLSLLALVFFGAAVFAVSRDGSINMADGMLLVGIFLFWQVIHLFDVLKSKTRKNVSIRKRIWIDLIIIGLCAWGIYSSIDSLVELIFSRTTGLFSRTHLGLLSGILMVVPNAFLAVYYSAVNRSDIAYSSQIGDCHICIPLCIGVFAIFSTITVYPAFQMTVYILIGAAATHLIFMSFAGKLPRLAGVFLTGVYVFFLYKNGLSP